MKKMNSDEMKAKLHSSIMYSERTLRYLNSVIFIVVIFSTAIA